uniref:RING-type E3 ubiquitin transferase n=1 Tax=Compsopogon caeruleus TaxID=31354 RepID=A0A7S1TGL2_9RHOD
MGKQQKQGVGSGTPTTIKRMRKVGKVDPVPTPVGVTVTTPSPPDLGRSSVSNRPAGATPMKTNANAIESAPENLLSNGLENKYVLVDVHSVMRELTCPICSGMIKETVLLSYCGHRFCRDCFTTASPMVCPVCRSAVALVRSAKDFASILRRDTRFDQIILEMEKYVYRIPVQHPENNARVISTIPSKQSERTAHCLPSQESKRSPKSAPIERQPHVKPEMKKPEPVRAKPSQVEATKEPPIAANNPVFSSSPKLPIPVAKSGTTPPPHISGLKALPGVGPPTVEPKPKPAVSPKPAPVFLKPEDHLNVQIIPYSKDSKIVKVLQLALSLDATIKTVRDELRRVLTPELITALRFYGSKSRLARADELKDHVRVVSLLPPLHAKVSSRTTAIYGM